MPYVSKLKQPERDALVDVVASVVPLFTHLNGFHDLFQTLVATPLQRSVAIL
jgi:hypothetical protein